MTILEANLKHLYQRIGCWFLGLGFLGGIALIVGTILHNRNGAFEGFLLWMYLFGLFTASMQVEILTKPFSFCLPGHNRVPRKFLFTVCLSASFFISAVFLLYPAPNLATAALTGISTALAGTIFYWLGAWVVFSFANWVSTLAFFSLFSFSQHLNIPIIVENIIVNHIPSVIAAGFLVNFLAYLHWGKSDIAKKYCGKLRLSGFDVWNKQKLHAYTQSRMAEKKSVPEISPAIEAFFIKRITNAGQTLGRYIWGSLYTTFAIMLSSPKKWLINLFIVIPVWLALGYLPGSGNIIFVMPGIMLIHAYLPIYSSLLITGGRRERFWSALSVALADTLLITVLVLVFAALTIYLKPIMPALTVRGYTAHFTALDIRLFFLPMLMAPITLAIGLICYKNPTIAIITVIAVFTAIWVATLASLGKAHIKLMPHITPLLITCLIVCAWAVFIAVSRYICVRRSLIKL